MIEVFADVVCPFTHAGLRRLVARRAEVSRTDVGIHLRAWPLEVVNGKPVSPRVVAEEVAALQAGVAPDLFAGFDAERFPRSSLPALALTAAAYASSARTGEEVGLELRDLLFEQGADLGDDAVLVAVAERYGLAWPDAGAAATVHDDFAEGRRRGVKGSPHFFAGGTDAFCPSLRITRPNGRLQVEFDRAGFEDFAGTALGTGGG